MKPPFELDEFDGLASVRGVIRSSNGINDKDGKLDYDEFINSIRKIPGIYGKFPGMSKFMSNFLDMFCNEDNETIKQFH